MYFYKKITQPQLYKTAHRCKVILEKYQQKKESTEIPKTLEKAVKQEYFALPKTKVSTCIRIKGQD